MAATWIFQYRMKRALQGVFKKRKSLCRQSSIKKIMKNCQQVVSMCRHHNAPEKTKQTSYHNFDQFCWKARLGTSAKQHCAMSLISYAVEIRMDVSIQKKRRAVLLTLNSAQWITDRSLHYLTVAMKILQTPKLCNLLRSSPRTNTWLEFQESSNECFLPYGKRTNGTSTISFLFWRLYVVLFLCCK